VSSRTYSVSISNGFTFQKSGTRKASLDQWQKLHWSLFDPFNSTQNHMIAGLRKKTMI